MWRTQDSSGRCGVANALQPIIRRSSTSALYHRPRGPPVITLDAGSRVARDRTDTSNMNIIIIVSTQPCLPSVRRSVDPSVSRRSGTGAATFDVRTLTGARVVAGSKEIASRSSGRARTAATATATSTDGGRIAGLLRRAVARQT